MQNLLDEYRRLAAEGSNFHGLSILQHKKVIGKLVQQSGATSLMDYGCGRGDQWHSPHNLHHYLGIKRKHLFLYDPSFPKHDKLPTDRTFDGVLCSDVLEHVPEEAVPAIIERLFSYSNLFVWASICCRPAKKAFADGTNMHVTVQPMTWWMDRFLEARKLHDIPPLFVLTETE